MMSQEENPSSISRIQPSTPMDSEKTNAEAENKSFSMRQFAFVGHKINKFNRCPSSSKKSLQVCVKDGGSIHDVLPSFDGEPLHDSSNMIHLPYDHSKHVNEGDHIDGSDPTLASSKAMLKGELKRGEDEYQLTAEYALTLASFKAMLKGKFIRGEEENQLDTEDSLTLSSLKAMLRGKVKGGEEENQPAEEYGITLASLKAMLKGKIKRGEEDNLQQEEYALTFPISSIDHVDQCDATLASLKAKLKGKLQIRSEEENQPSEEDAFIFQINSTDHVDGSDPTLASLKKALQKRKFERDEEKYQYAKEDVFTLPNSTDEVVDSNPTFASLKALKGKRKRKQKKRLMTDILADPRSFITLIEEEEPVFLCKWLHSTKLVLKK